MLINCSTQVIIGNLLWLYKEGGVLMNIISLDKQQRYFLDGKFFLVKKGRIIARDILENGKIITNENYLIEGDLIGNFFTLLPRRDLFIPEIEIEIEALENNTILEEFKFSSEEIFCNVYSEKVVIQLIKKSIFKFFYQLYDTKGYILAVLKLYLNNRTFISKKEIHYENFNISKSQFYLIYSKLKKENFIIESNNKIFLNLDKVNSYLEELGEYN